MSAFTVLAVAASIPTLILTAGDEKEKFVVIELPRSVTDEPELEAKFLVARSKDIRAGRLPEFNPLLDRASKSKQAEVRVWALSRLVEAGDLNRYPELAHELAEHIRTTALGGSWSGKGPFRKTFWIGLPQTIHHSSPFYLSLDRTIRDSPMREVTTNQYVVWCYNTLPNQRELIYEIAAHVETPIRLKNPDPDPWNDPRFWIVTDWALAWGEAEDFDKLRQVMPQSRARDEFQKIADLVTKIPGFFACRNVSPLEDRASRPPISPPLGPQRVPAGGFTNIDYSATKVKFQPPAPKYPVEAKQRRLNANLEIQILIDTQGNVCGARTAPGPFLAFFTPVALEFASRWIFEPAKREGIPQNAQFRLTMPFRLR